MEDKEVQPIRASIACAKCLQLMRPLVRIPWTTKFGVRCLHHCEMCNQLAIEYEFAPIKRLDMK